MNIEDYKKVYCALASKESLFLSIDDIIKRLNIGCYDAVKQAIFDVSHNNSSFNKTASDSKDCESLKQCLSFGSYIGMVLSYKKPDFLDLFIDENQDALSRFSIKRFLGSGQIGDAWELADNKILKIFDNSIQNDIMKYEQAKEVLDDKDNSSDYDISIYEIGRLKVPDKYFGIKTPSFSYIGVPNEDRPEYEPAYVILEKLTTYSSLVGSYTESFEDSESLPSPLVKSGLPEDKPFRDAIRHNSDPKFIVDIFMTYIGDIIIQNAIRAWYVQTIEYYSKNNSDIYGRKITLDDEIRNRIGDFFFSRIQKIKELAKMFIEQLPDNRGFPEARFVEAYTAILKSARPSLPDDWLFRLAESTISKLEMGHKDVHTGNVGIRAEGDLNFVYYDS